MDHFCEQNELKNEKNDEDNTQLRIPDYRSRLSWEQKRVSRSHYQYSFSETEKCKCSIKKGDRTFVFKHKTCLVSYDKYTLKWLCKVYFIF